jgi:phosphoenolpyruvate carboxylase
MKTIRDVPLEETLRTLKSVQRKFAKYQSDELKKVAHAFALMLELINRCESAYRSNRLDQKQVTDYTQKPHAIIFVFTAHPTEARSPQLLHIFQQVYYTLLDALKEGKTKHETKLNYWLALALATPIARITRPSVEDEARYLYSYVLRNEIISEQIEFLKKGITVNFRSWVGGDKDGHPGVDEKTLMMSLTLSREKILDWLMYRLNTTIKDLPLLNINEKAMHDITTSYDNLQEQLISLRSIKEKDGQKVITFQKSFNRYKDKLQNI